MKENPKCPKCQCQKVKKNGKVEGIQRYKCKECNYQFTRTTPRGRPLNDKIRAITLYAQGLSIRAIARNVGVSATTILRWIKKFARDNDVRPEPGDAIVVEIDEMCHYVGKKNQ